jgi:hypothetical protein
MYIQSAPLQCFRANSFLLPRQSGHFSTSPSLRRHCAGGCSCSCSCSCYNVTAPCFGAASELTSAQGSISRSESQHVHSFFFSCRLVPAKLVDQACGLYRLGTLPAAAICMSKRIKGELEGSDEFGVAPLSSQTTSRCTKHCSDK